MTSDYVTSNKLPHGKSILHPDWPDAIWDLGGLFIHDSKIFELLDDVESEFGYRLPLTSVFGCYSVMWSGGRGIEVCDAPKAHHQGWTPRNLFQDYNSKGIGVTLTFSNTLIEEKHLSDPSSNYLLDMLGEQHYEGNYVTVTSDILSDYIRKRYPDLKQKASIVKSTMEMPKKRTFEYYDNLTERFDQVYLHPDDNFSYKLLKEIADSGKATRYTSLINEMCVRNCSIRDNHYDEISRAVIDGWHGMFNFTNVNPIHHPSHPNSICERWAKRELRLCTLSKTEMKQIYDLGFRNFKLQGRDGPWPFIVHDFCNWMVEPEVIAGNIQKMVKLGGRNN